jgi:SAM-dependent methyltransferase
MFERPEQSMESAITPEFLSEQVSLPREQWSDQFKAYVEQKIQEGHSESTERDSWEQERRDTFDRYAKGTDLSQENLRDKVVIDLGSGDGELVEECVDRDLSKGVYGIDVQQPRDAEKYKQHFFQGNFEESLPVKEADYIVSVGAVSVFEHELDLEKVLDNAFDALKENGELRIYPVQRSSPGSDLVGLEESYKRWNELLAKMTATGKIEYTLKPIDIRVSGTDNDVWLEELLIVKKPSSQNK